MQKKLEDMNLLENFLFESVLSYPEIGEKFGKKLLEIIFGRLKVFPQKVYPGSDTNLHGARLDVYFEEEDFDPFGRDRVIYTIKNRCIEDPDMPYEDGAVTIFLYTKGIHGVVSETLRQLLTYMEDTTMENACNDDLQEMHRMVE
ncbi:MAG: hypothetical protein J6K48_00735 [Lachnospiraceae bacterium]|nr:hypothetical protein [Lachnospiraceae bacterium]